MQHCKRCGRELTAKEAEQSLLAHSHYPPLGTAGREHWATIYAPLCASCGATFLQQHYGSSTSPFVQGKLHAPYFIFHRSAGRFSDADLLQRFALPDYRRTATVQHLGRYAICADDGQWTMIADDWYYTLWHNPSTRPAMAELAESGDVFACSIGDCDHSFDFIYYRDGRVIRKYVVADADFRGGSVIENLGEPLPGEPAAFKQKDEMDIVLGVAAGLGIKTDYAEKDVRLYAPLSQPPTDLGSCLVRLL